MKSRTLSPDAQVTLLLTTHLALPKGPAAAKLKPLSPTEWNDLASTLVAHKVRPGALLSTDSSRIQAQFGLAPDYAVRMEQLLARGAQLAFEVERLDSLGIWVLTRSDVDYPNRFKERLGAGAPPVLFGAGQPALLTQGFLSVVGSRDVDEEGARFAGQVGEASARSGLTLVSGGARGVDRLSMSGALSAGGSAIGILADNLERAVRDPEYRAAAAQGRLTLVSAVHPKAPFVVANAMARNRLIYCMAQYGLVVTTSQDKGGTWAGAQEVLKHRWVPLFVRSGEGAPEGNRALIEQGALEFGPTVPVDGLKGWLEEHSAAWTQIAATTTRRSLRDAGQPKGGRTGGTTGNPNDLFPVVWPHIAERLGMWPHVLELALQLKVEPVQLELWLKLAAEAGLVVCDPSTGQYALPSEADAQVQARFEL